MVQGGGGDERGTLRPPALLIFALALVVVEVDGVKGHDVLEQLRSNCTADENESFASTFANLMGGLESTVIKIQWCLLLLSSGHLLAQDGWLLA